MGLDIPSSYRLIGATKLLAVLVIIGLDFRNTRLYWIISR